jgi:4-aminobutyrate aminotransferase-like enzyme
VILTTTNGQPAAFLAETIQGVGGYIVPPPGYFQRVAEIIRRYGGLLIIDEVQAGFGRTGMWFGIEHWGVEPDIMVMAKGIAGGLPVGATITRPEIADSWGGKTISTFGGNPICMAGMAETLDVMREEDVPSIAREQGARLKSGMESLADRYGWIGEVRGLGLMMGVELVKDRDTKEPAPELAIAFMEASKAEGILLGKAGHKDQVIRLAPALLVTESEVDEALDRIGRACARVDAGLGG